MIDYLKRVFSRVNKGRDAKKKIWNLIVQKSNENEQNAQKLQSLLYWMTSSHLNLDRSRSIMLLFQLGATFPALQNNLKIVAPKPSTF